MSKLKLVPRALMRLVYVDERADFRRSAKTHYHNLPDEIREQLTPHRCAALVSTNGDHLMFVFGEVEVSTGEHLLTSRRVDIDARSRFTWRMWQEYAERVGIQLEGFRAFADVLKEPKR